MKKRSGSKYPAQLLAPLSGALIALSAMPGAALAATAPQNFQQLANQVVSVISNATVDLIVFAVVLYMWGAASNIFKGGEESRKNLRTQLLWGVFVIFLAVSIWGVVRLLQTSVFGQGDVTNGTGGSSSAVTTICTGLNCTSPFNSP